MSRIPITLRAAPDGTWWALNKREDGFASYGFPFPYLGDALDYFDARIVAWGRDRHGLYLSAARGRTR